MGLIDRDLLRKGGVGVSCLIAAIKVTLDDEDKRRRDNEKPNQLLSNADSLSKHIIQSDLVRSILDEEESGKRT